MPYFIVLASDRPDALPERKALRQAHLDYWNGRHGAVKVAGAILEGDEARGSSFLLEARDEDEVRALLADDPFTQAGVFAGEMKIVKVRPAIGDWFPA